MIKTGILPTGFRTALLTHIPKSKEIYAQAKYRFVSESTHIYTLLELILKQRMSFLEEQHTNKVGYKRATPCKSAYFIVYETISYYKSEISICHVISLNAVRAYISN